MEIWVVFVKRACYAVEDYITLYLKKEAAYEAAIDNVESILFNNRQKFQHCQGEIEKIKGDIYNHKYQQAIDTLNKLSEDFGDKSFVKVYLKSLVGDGKLKVADVPCRQCGRGVQPNDKECWWCTTNNPAKNA